MASQADIRAVDNAIEASQTVTGDALSFWDRLGIFITPESHGESIVNEIYGSSPARTLLQDPAYDRNDLSSPNVYVRGKETLKSAAEAITGFTTKGIIFLAIIVVILVLGHAAITAFIRR